MAPVNLIKRLRSDRLLWNGGERELWTGDRWRAKKKSMRFLPSSKQHFSSSLHLGLLPWRNTIIQTQLSDAWKDLLDSLPDSGEREIRKWGPDILQEKKSRKGHFFPSRNPNFKTLFSLNPNQMTSIFHKINYLMYPIHWFKPLKRDKYSKTVEKESSENEVREGQEKNKNTRKKIDLPQFRLSYPW